MDYLSFKFLNRDLDRKSDERLRRPPPPSPHAAAAAAAAAAPSPTSIKTSNSTNSTRQPSPRFSLPNDDPLPTSFAALEGHLNHHASQLQQLADRVDSINEMIELDNIVLARLVRDEEKRVDDLIATEHSAPAAAQIDTTTNVKPVAVHSALGPNSPTSGLPLMALPPGEKMAKRSASMGDVPRSAPLPPPKTDSQRKEEAVREHSGVKEARERIRAMKRWKSALEGAVVWQREEFWRVEAAMGKQKGGVRRESVMLKDGVGEGKEARKDKGEEEGKGGEKGNLQVVGGENWGEGKKEKWSRDSAQGRLPTQKEWEGLFSQA